MSKKNDLITIAFTGGGTGGHIYPGLAVCDSLRKLTSNKNIKIVWIGNSKGMDKEIVSKACDSNGLKSADVFYGIPSGKLRRYFSLQNFFDIFKIILGFIKAYFILLKVRPAILFSKGGFVSVPPCIASRLLKIPVFTHECDFTPGLATRINSKSCTKILVSYKETLDYLSSSLASKAVVTGNPVRPQFYTSNEKEGLEFLGISNKTKPILLVLGGSLGAKQLNDLVKNNINFLLEHFTVVHQCGKAGIEEMTALKESLGAKASDYLPYAFIYSQMCHVIKACDIVLSRSGANTIWESAVSGKPMVLVPLTGSGTRGDQEDNAKYFESKGAAIVLSREDVTDDKLQSSLMKLLDTDTRASYASSSLALGGSKAPSESIAELIYEEIK